MSNKTASNRHSATNFTYGRKSVGTSFYYTTDALGSTILLTDSAQAKAATYLYDSWGNTTTQTGTQAAANPWRYAGGYKDDATGYTKFGARYYAPLLGRFNQADPSGQEQNRYLYAGANPCNNTDPSGLDAGPCVLSAIGLGAGIFGIIGAAATIPVTGPVGFWAASGLFLSIFGAASGGTGVIHNC